MTITTTKFKIHLRQNPRNEDQILIHPAKKKDTAAVKHALSMFEIYNHEQDGAFAIPRAAGNDLLRGLYSQINYTEFPAK